MRDPETLAHVRGFVVSPQFGQSIGTNLLELFAKATGKRRNALSHLTVYDAFLMATMAAILRETHAPLTQNEMGICANILMTLLPVDRLTAAGVADETLRHIANSKILVRKIQRTCGI
jgi:hypothetical protein